MDHSDFYRDLVRKTAHGFPEQIQKIYLSSRKIYEELENEIKDSSKEENDLLYEIILPSIAIYKSIIQHAGNAEKAYEVISRTYEDYYQEKVEKLRSACKNPIMFYLVPTMVGNFIKKNYNDKAGYKTNDHSKGLKLCHIDIVECPYYKYCKMYQCEELTTAFCEAADQAFNHLRRGISWDRTKALGRGDDCCDFIISIDD